MVPRRGEEAGRSLTRSPREHKRSCRGDDQGGCTPPPSRPAPGLNSEKSSLRFAEQNAQRVTADCFK